MIKYFFILFSTFVCGQSYQNVKPLEGRGEIEQGVYYKDFNNVFGAYEGSYEFTGNAFYFKITLKKVTEVGSYFYEDRIVGQYQFIKDGIDINYLNDPYTPEDGEIEGSWIRQPMPRFCPECLPEKWLTISIYDPVTERSCSLYIAKRIVSGQEGIYVWFYYKYGPQMPWESDEPARLPTGEFFMRKL